MLETVPELRRLLLWGFPGIVLCLLGCSGASESDSRLEHHVPAHRPANFLAAIPELERRNPFQTEGAKNSAAVKSDSAATSLSELRDIIRWLPELAAETTLTRKPWEIVAQTSRNLEALLDRPSGGQSQADRHQEYQTLIEQLSQAAQTLKDDRLERIPERSNES